mmetsp:Transcript_14190/g.16990  ORF Transcript_14190/g.16990 Transcript_14190/m.16990 type:complete len:339 (+) Transcript_14190:87-1103(+)|eukprot:jgi/Bigna1/86824/estExt_fgenesh1_pg.C_140080
MMTDNHATTSLAPFPHPTSRFSLRVIASATFLSAAALTMFFGVSIGGTISAQSPSMQIRMPTLNGPRTRVGLRQNQIKRIGRLLRRSSVGGEMPEPAPAEDVKYSPFGAGVAHFPEGWNLPDARATYEDSAFDSHMLGIFMKGMAREMEQELPENITYEDFIKLCFASIQGKGPGDQTEASLKVLRSFLPPGPGKTMFVGMFPENKLTYELFAKVTETGFEWLVGPMETQETTDNNAKTPMASKVKIKKCRWLQESACTGMCINLCKRPTEAFFRDNFGVTMTINPNYEDKSCEFCFGLTPPPPEEDPAYKFPCHPRCSSASTVLGAEKPCHKVAPES